MKGLNSSELDQRLLKLSTALLVQKEVRGCTHLKQLYTYLTTETAALHCQDQAFLFGLRGTRLQLLNAGNVTPANPDAPLNLAVRRVIATNLKDEKASTVHVIPAEITDSLYNTVTTAGGLSHHWLWLPLKNNTNTLIGVLVLLRATPWSNRELVLAETMCEAYGYSVYALQTRPRFQLRLRIPAALLVLLTLMLLYFIKIPLMAFGEAEVVSRTPIAITSPVNGVVQNVYVKPFTQVAKGDLLLSFDRVELQAARDVAEKTLKVTEAELEKIRLQSYLDTTMKAQLNIWEKKAELHSRELEFTEQKLSDCEIRAAADGVIFYDDRFGWEGRPVITGERLMQLVDPDDTLLRIDVPIRGMIPLQNNLPVSFFPNTNPAKSTSGNLVNIGLEPYPAADHTFVYSHKARLDTGTDSLSIGSRGTARISGEKVRLGYYLFRRPMARVRQFLGI